MTSSFVKSFQEGLTAAQTFFGSVGKMSAEAAQKLKYASVLRKIRK